MTTSKKTTYIYLLLIIIGNFNYCFSQTKLETEEWILSKLNTYSNSGITVLTPKFNKSVKFSIKEGLLIMTQNTYPTLIIPLKDISSYSYEVVEGFQDDVLGTIPTFVAITLRCKAEEKCTNAYDHDTNRFVISDSKFVIILDANFTNENLPERMKKAISNLVKYNGGQLIDEKY